MTFEEEREAYVRRLVDLATACQFAGVPLLCDACRAAIDLESGKLDLWVSMEYRAASGRFEFAAAVPLCAACADARPGIEGRGHG